MKIIFILISLALFLSLSATIINIPADQPTIQEGINVAVDGDTVLVQPGLYLENILISNKAITVSSLFLTTQDTSYISQTIIDGNHENYVIRYYNEIDSTSVLCGFTITNGNGYHGSGINSCGSSTQFRNLIITQNTSSGYGGGMFLEYGNPSIDNCIIENNSAGLDGGAIFLWKQCNAVLNNVVISNNTSGRNGGGIYCVEYCDLIIENSIISNNTADEYGGGICNDYHCNMVLGNVTIRDNSASRGGGIFSNDLYSELSFDPINRCNIYSNSINDSRGYGTDIFAYDCDVIVDTFTVLNPTDYYASPIENFTFDILHEIGNSQVNADLYVSVDGDNANSGITVDEPLKSIKFALSKIYSDSLNHNTIYLSPGIYSSSTNGENFPIAWSNHVSLEGNAEEDTFLDAENTNQVISFHYVTDASLRNITIRNGFADDGGGIYCYHSNPILENITISENVAESGGGIACFDYSSPTLLNVKIINNQSENHGGGISCRDYSNPILENVDLINNSAFECGGGIDCFDYSSPNLQNVNITGNTAASDGGGIRCLSYSNPILQNVTITNNTSSEEGGGIHCKNNSVPIFSNINRCNIYLNYAGTDGNDLFSTEPLFVIADTFTVAQPDDYHASPIENFTFNIINSVIEQAFQDLYISPFGSDENSGLTADDPLQTISFALLKIYGDSLNTYTIHLSEGTFSPTQTGENFPLNCKDYTSISGAEQNLTILDGEDLSTVISCSGDNNFSIENLTVTNGNGYNGGGISFMSNSAPHLKNLLITNNHGYDGGGIYCYSYSSPSIENVEIINNQADYRGGGILCTYSSSPHILNSVIDNNIAPWGGGIRLYYNCNAIIENVSISNNSASAGAGIYCNSSDPTLQNVIISNNIASATNGGNGGGIVCVRSEMTLLNTIIENNSSMRNGGGIYCILYSELNMENVIITNNTSNGSGGGIYCDDQYDVYAKNITFADNYAHNSGGGIYLHNDYHTYLTLRNAIFWNNPPYDIGGSASVTIISYSNTNYGFGGPHNMWEDPLFIGTGEFPYALQEDSPCIDMGYPSANYYDPEDPENPGFALYPARGTITNDMGAYGGPNAFAWNPVSVEDDIIIVNPALCQLSQNFPNPFNPSTTIKFSIPEDSRIEISVYNIKGQKVITLANGEYAKGSYSVIWDGIDGSNNSISSGVYLYKLNVNGKTEAVKKCLLLK